MTAPTADRLPPDVPAAIVRQYGSHRKHLKLRGLPPRTIDTCARATRRLSRHFDDRIDALTEAPLSAWFSDLIASQSWSAVWLDRQGLKFFAMRCSSTRRPCPA